MFNLYIGRDSIVAQLVKNLPALGWEDALEKGMATHSRILAWGILWTMYSPCGRKESDTTERLSLAHTGIFKYVLLKRYPI